jgi:cytochrome c oxidase subunit 2
MSDAHLQERWILHTELLWAFGAGVFIAAALGMIIFTALMMSINPPSNVERIDPKTLHLSGEFVEHNLGTVVGPDGKVIVRAIATQFMFVPRCIAVPAKRLVTLRFATPDVIHGTADHRHQRQHHGRARLCGAGTYGVHPHRGSAHALP